MKLPPLKVPALAADGADLHLGAAAGNVFINTNECGSVDLCKLALVVKQIKDGLAAIV
jgi:hypothetical protein